MPWSSSGTPSPIPTCQSSAKDSAEWQLHPVLAERPRGLLLDASGEAAGNTLKLKLAGPPQRKW
ncbi:MAG: hypothetical protein U0791_10005 [Gemmataceae bacterium]